MLRVRRRLELPQRTNLQPADALPGTSRRTPDAGRILEIRKTETTAQRGLLDVGEIETHDRRQQAAKTRGRGRPAPGPRRRRPADYEARYGKLAATDGPA